MTPTEQALDLTPYLPRLALEWLAEAPQETYREIDGTVAFVDISGFTKLSERLARRGKVGAEELADAIGCCFRELLAVAYADGGSLLKFGGDALLLLFDGDDHVLRACRAAVGMRATLRSVGRLTTSAGLVRLRMSVGVHSGRFGFFLVGETYRELFVAGPAATQTVLMEQAAEAGEIVVSEAVAAALPARCVGRAKAPGLLLRAAPLGAPEAPERVAPVEARTDPAIGVPPDVREHLLGGGCEPEHRLATVTFLRFEGADEVMERNGPADLAARIAAVTDAVQRAAREQGVAVLGSDIDRDGGKLFLAAGAPRSTGADEERTLVAVRRIIDAELPLPVRIGVNRGHVFAGDIGPSYRRTYTVMGDTVNLAARLMAAARPGEILTTAPVLERSRTPFETRELPPLTVKGKARPVEAFAVGGAAEETAVGSSAALPLIGRDAELAQVLEAVAHAKAHRGRVLSLVGDAGMGASRIAEEARDRSSDLTVLWATGGPYAAATPYFPFRALLRDMLGVRTDSNRKAAAQRLRERVEANAPELVAWLPLIAAIMDVPIDPTPETEALADEFRRARLEAVAVEFFSVALPTATMLVFEDVHYFDEASAGLLRALAASAGTHPWLVLATRREGIAMEGGDLPSPARTVQLCALSAADARTFAEAATEDAPLPEHEIQAIVERAGGNPLVLRELVAAARSAGSVEGLPDSLEALMTARIDQLPPRDRTVLRNASVLGTVFGRSHLEAVLGGNVPEPGDPVWRRLAQYVRPYRDGYRFANPLIRDAAYEGLSFRVRKTLHAQVGETIVRSSPDPEEQAELLALHFFHAGRYEETWRFSRVAGERAQSKYANVEAARFFARALEAARRMDGVSPNEIASVHESAGDAWNLAGEYRRAEVEYRAARRSAPGDVVSDSRRLFKEAQIADRLGRLSVALQRLTRGCKLLGGLRSEEARGQRAQLWMWYAAVRQMQGNHRDAIRWSRRAIREAEASTNRSALAYASKILHWAQDSIGEAGDGSNLKRALEIYEELGDLKGQGSVLNNLGAAEYFAGRWDRALELYERGRLVHEKIGDPVQEGIGVFNIGEILSDQGRLSEAEPLLRRAFRVWKAAGERDSVAYALSQLGRNAARAKRFDEALSLYEEAKREFAEVGDTAALLETGARIAECLVLKGSPEEALALIDDLIPQDRAKGGTSQIASLLLRTRGEALMQQGDLPAARIALAGSLEAARARGADYEIGLTLRALAALADLEGTADPESETRSKQILIRLGVLAA